MEVLLISEETLKSYSLINDNVDGAYVLPSIVLSQEVGLQQLIGTTLLRKIKALVADGSIEYEENAKYKTLLTDYVKNYLLWQTTSELQVPVSFKTTNSGVVQNDDTNKSAVDMKNVQYLKEYYAQKATFFGKLLTDYLCTNNSLYPEYRGNSKDGLVADDDDYAHIYFPGVCNKRRKNYY